MRRHRLLTVFILSCIFAFFAATAVATDPPKTFRDVRNWVELGNVLGAMNYAEEQGLFDQAPDPKDSVDVLLRDVRAIYKLPENRRGAAIDAFEEHLKSLKMPGDAALMAAVSRYVDSVVGDRAYAEAESEALLVEAQNFFDHGKYSDASALLESVVKQKSLLSADLVSRARLLQIKADREAKAEGFWIGLWREFQGSVATISKWLFYFGGAVVVVAILVAIRRWFPVRKGTRIAMDDTSVAAADRNSAGPALGRELFAAIAALDQDGNRVGRVDLASDMDSLGVAHLRFRLQVQTSIDTFIKTTDPVSVGPFSFTPQQIFALCASYFQKDSESTLRGTLAKVDNQFQFSAELDTRKKEEDGGDPLGAADTRWQVSADTHEKAVDAMAQHIAFSLGTGAPTKSWPSFEAHQRGNALLALQNKPPADREAVVKEALECFRSSLAYDPFNFLARFDLAATLRILGRNKEATSGFGNLEELLSQNLATVVSDFQQRHPEFLSVVQYNRALSLAKLMDDHSLDEAETVLDTLRQALTNNVHPAESEFPRLEILVRSAIASVWAMQLDLEMEDEQGTGLRTPQARARLQQIVKIRNWLNKQVSQVSAQNWRTYDLSRAVVENAYGRASYLFGQLHLAEEAFHSALARVPTFVEAHINLASTLRKRRRSIPDWSDRALAEIGAALDLEPANPKANHLKGVILSDSMMGNYDDAIAALRKAGKHWGSLARLAVIYAGHTQGKMPDAIDAMRASIRLHDRPDYRFIQFVDFVLKLEPKAGLPLLQEAKSIGERLRKSAASLIDAKGAGAGRQESLLKNISKLLQQVSGRISDLGRNAPETPPPAQPAAAPPANP